MAASAVITLLRPSQLANWKPVTLLVTLLSNSVKKATSNSSLKAMSSRLVWVSAVIDGGGGPLGRVPCACCWMAVSWEEGLATLGKPSDRGNVNGAAETMVDRHERPTRDAEAILECIIDLLSL